jgi:hypothetical protein
MPKMRTRNGRAPPGPNAGTAPATKVFLLFFLQKKKNLILFLKKQICFSAAGARQSWILTISDLAISRLFPAESR